MLAEVEALAAAGTAPDEDLGVVDGEEDARGRRFWPWRIAFDNCNQN